MEKQKEALSRIVGTVNSKYEESQIFSAELESELESLQACYENSIANLNSQFQVLAECLDNARRRMVSEIEIELSAKEKPLQDRLRSFEEARMDAEDLIKMSNKALDMSDPSEFSKAALKIKDRVTMSPVFRLSLNPIEVDPDCYHVVDFSREQRILNNMKFLPVPCQPEIIETGCYVQDNVIHCVWSITDEEDHAVMDSEIFDPQNSVYSEQLGQLPSSVDYFIFQYRQVQDGMSEGPWTTVENVRSLEHDIKGLLFHSDKVEVRVQAWNRALGGSWSEVYAISTPSYRFAFNPEACHPNIKVVTEDLVEWDTTAKQVQDTRSRSAGLSRSASPSKGGGATSPRRVKKDRFTGESYTVLGDTTFSEEESYFEVVPHPDCKTYSVGIASKSIARFDQLGKTSTSWCLHVSNWIQNTFVAKHNNKVKNLESTGKPPSKIGVYFNQGAGILSFYNADTKQVVHTFKQVKCNTQLLPGFLIWFGSMQLFTGIQVPSWVLTPNFNKSTESGSSENV